MKNITVALEAAGCNTACMHCWANGGRYENMAIKDIEYTIKGFYNFCIEYGFNLCTYPMHEPLAHPDIIDVLQLIKDNLIGTKVTELIEPMTTSGVPIATRDDWKKVLTGIKELGSNTIWFAFHGVGDTHDRAVNRKGAFKELCTAVDRVKNAGFQYGSNVFVTKENISQLHQMKELFKEMKMGTTLFDIPRYEPSRRAVIYDSIRPELGDLISIKDEIAEMCPGWHNKIWRELDDYTEASYYKRALSGSIDEFKYYWSTRQDDIYLVCRNNLDIYNGDAGIYGKFYGNLKDDKESVLMNLLDDIQNERYEFRNSPACYYNIAEFPDVKELALKYGDPDSTRIYPGAETMRFKWLDRAFSSQRKR